MYEGHTTDDIRREIPEWSVWDSPLIGCESLKQVGRRSQRVMERVLSMGDGDVALLAHGHILRVVAACWLDQLPIAGRLIALDTGSVSIWGTSAKHASSVCGTSSRAIRR